MLALVVYSSLIVVNTLRLCHTSAIHFQGDYKESVYDFEYNHMFGPESTQADVFEDVKQLVQCAVLGYNVCIFAYGQTGVFLAL